MTTTVGHIRHKYLPITETFIYNQLTNIKKYRTVFFANSLENIDHFPFKNVCLSHPKRFSLWRLFEIVSNRFGNKNIYLKHLMKKFKVRLIHAHFGNDGVRMLPVKKSLGIPLITSFYGYDGSRLPKENKWKHRYRLLFKYGDCFLVEGNYFKKTLVELGCLPEKVIVNHLGIDTEKFRFVERQKKKPDEKKSILFCSGFREKKGLSYALNAIGLLKRKSPNISFRVIGDGPLRMEIEKLIRDNGLNQCVHLLGYQSYDVYLKELNEADILIQPSVTALDGDNEGGAPMVLLEAQSTGLPVVSTYHCDIPEYVIDGKSGFLVPERDSESLAEKLEILLKNAGLRGEMGRTGSLHVKKEYDVRKQVIKLEKIYSQVLTKYEQ